VWAQPSRNLQNRVVAAIAAEAGTGRRLRRIRNSIMAAAAAGDLAAGVTVGLHATLDQPVQFGASLTGTGSRPMRTRTSH
jgi:hypothetical protein